MTPDCSTCGYAVDWLRSCYSSQWRLFAGFPEVLTPGYYYFRDNSTPFYPGLHNVWSGTWVHPELIDPDLGEASGPRRWRDGSLPVAPPAPRQLGATDCIALGEPFPPLDMGRTLVAGIDCRCWDQCPDPPAALWLRPEGLSKAPVGSALQTWPDSSIYQDDAVMATPSVLTHVVSQGVPAWKGVLLVDVGWPQVQSTVVCSGDLALWAVATITTGGQPGFVLIAEEAQSGGIALLNVQSSVLEASTTDGTVIFPGTITTDRRCLYSVRRVKDQWTASVNGVSLGPPQAGPTGESLIDLPWFAPAGATSWFGVLHELQITSGPLSDDGYAATTTSLLSKYAITP